MMLQIDAANGLMQYGVLGIFAVLLVGALVFVFKMYAAQHEKQLQLTEKRIDELQKNLEEEKDSRLKLEAEFRTYISTDNQKVMQALVETKNAIDNNTALLQVIKSKL